MEIGERVGCILAMTSDEVRFLGWGTYEGEHIPSKEQNSVLHEVKIHNPKIKLDNGNTVWGYQCWWASEEKINKMISDKKITIVNIDDFEI